MHLAAINVDINQRRTGRASVYARIFTMAGATLTAPILIVEDTNASVCNDWECSDGKLWTAEEFLLFEGTHKELLLCHDNYGVSGHLRLVQFGVR